MKCYCHLCFFYRCKQSLNRLLVPSIHPPTHHIFLRKLYYIWYSKASKSERIRISDRRLTFGCQMVWILDVRISDIKCVPNWDEKVDHFIYKICLWPSKAKTTLLYECPKTEHFCLEFGRKIMKILFGNGIPKCPDFGKHRNMNLLYELIFVALSNHFKNFKCINVQWIKLRTSYFDN